MLILIIWLKVNWTSYKLLYFCFTTLVHCSIFCYKNPIVVVVVSVVKRILGEITKQVLLQNFRYDLSIDTIHNISIFEIEEDWNEVETETYIFRPHELKNSRNIRNLLLCCYCIIRLHMCLRVFYELILSVF